jgi:hypothetical protein
LPSGLTNIDPFCENSEDSLLTPLIGVGILCSYDSLTRTFSISNFNDLAVGSKIGIYFYASTPVATTAISLIIKIYKD